MKTKDFIESQTALFQKIERENQSMRNCPIKKAKAIFDEFRQIVQRKGTICFMHLKFPGNRESKLIKKEEMMEWSGYHLSKTFEEWAPEALKYLISERSANNIRIEHDAKDNQWIVAIKPQTMLVMRIPQVDWATIEEELKDRKIGSHSKTIRIIISIILL